MCTKRFILSFVVMLAVSPLFAQKADWAWFGKYSEANANVTAKPKAVLLGDSITEGWAGADPDFFTANNFVGRG